MSNLIKNLRIQNFKSIKDVTLDCERINVFIGKPNAGKSNILEAVSLLGGGDVSSNKFMDGCIRYEKITELFSDFNIQKPIEITADNVSSRLTPYDSVEKKQIDQFWFRGGYNEYNKNPSQNFIPDAVIDIKPDGKVIGKTYNGLNPIKKYSYRLNLEYQEKGFFLSAPYGENLYFIVQTYPELRSEIQNFLKPNGLELLLDLGAQRFYFVKKNETTLFSFSFHLVPDTFQRYIFHLAAIFSNKNSVLLFEEPESHSYGPYIYQLSQRIIDDEGGNQYFLTTHNPYFLFPLMREDKDVAVFTTWFENYETHVKRLNEEEIQEILDYGIDPFYNLGSFIPG